MTDTRHPTPHPRRAPAHRPLPLLLGAAALSLAPWSQAQVSTEPVRIEAPALEKEGKDRLQVQDTRLGKGLQALRDVPQSLTVVTEKLLDERNLDTLKDALKQTAGISFLAAEGGEEDIRLRGFSLQGTGDVFLDGIREPAFYDRDSFALDRLEVLRGSASMLFGRGSTGGAVNQVFRIPRTLDEGSVDLTVGSHRHRRLVVDLNKALAPDAGMRMSAMQTQADNNGSGTALDKRGLMGAVRWGIGTAHEFLLQAYRLENQNGIHYGLPWIRPQPNATASQSTLLPLDPTTSYALSSDRNAGTATHLAGTYTHRWNDHSEWRTQVRAGRYARDQRASTIRFAGAALQPDGQAVSLATLSPSTVLTRGTQLKIQDLDAVYGQSDLQHRLRWGDVVHTLTAGVDWAHEQKTVWAARTGPTATGLNPQGGVTLLKPNTSLGTPHDGAWVDEAARVLRVANTYDSQAWGAYLQDLMQVAPHWKVLGGIRFDRLSGNYSSYGAPTDAVNNGPQSSYGMRVAQWSQRAGVLFQPTSRHTFHASAGTSFNTSGDAYSLGPSNADTPPEQSINWEVGGKMEAADGRFSTRMAVFRATKLRERNTDPLLPVVTLTGRRHVAGLEWDAAGRLSSAWEVFASWTWLPQARVDEAAPCPSSGACAQAAPGERPGDRPALTPVHSGAAWTTWQVDPQWRLGAGLTFRGRQAPARAEFTVPGFVVADAMVEWTPSDRHTLRMNVSNLANTRYADQLYVAHYVPGAGRLVQLTASYRY